MVFKLAERSPRSSSEMYERSSDAKNANPSWERPSRFLVSLITSPSVLLWSIPQFVSFREVVSMLQIILPFTK